MRNSGTMGHHVDHTSSRVVRRRHRPPSIAGGGRAGNRGAREGGNEAGTRWTQSPGERYARRAPAGTEVEHGIDPVDPEPRRGARAGRPSPQTRALRLQRGAHVKRMCSAGSRGLSGHEGRRVHRRELRPRPRLHSRPEDDVRPLRREVDPDPADPRLRGPGAPSRRRIPARRGLPGPAQARTRQARVRAGGLPGGRPAIPEHLPRASRFGGRRRSMLLGRCVGIQGQGRALTPA